MNVLVVNAGSSSLKYQLFDTSNDTVIAKGLCDRIGIDGTLTHKQLLTGKVLEKSVSIPNHTVAMKYVVDALLDAEYGCVKSMDEIEAVGHRIVHGGAFFSESVLLTEDVMAKLELCGAAQNTAGMLRRKELFYRLLSFVYGNGDLETENTAYAPIVKGVLLLKQTYLENLPIETFAEQSNVSISLFRRLFHQQYGMSPLQYRNLLRINRAKQLLEYDYSTVAEVAYACGFENVGYFCRYYKRITGETPTQTRQK